MRLYVNSPNGISFTDDIRPTQDISLLEGADRATEYPVRVLAFTSVTSVTIFFVSNIDHYRSEWRLKLHAALGNKSDSPLGDRSRVYYVGFKGESTKAIKEPGGKLDIPAANAADAPVHGLAERAAGSQTTAR